MSVGGLPGAGNLDLSVAEAAESAGRALIEPVLDRARSLTDQGKTIDERQVLTERAAYAATEVRAASETLAFVRALSAEGRCSELLELTAGAAIAELVPPQALFQQLYQGAEYDLLQAVVFFIVAGNVMTRGSLASRLIKVGQALVGGFSGGLAITAVLLCMFFAAISGSSPATVVAIGTIMIPALIKSGYNERFSVGLLTTAGSLGIMIPPSIPMIIWAVVVGVSVTKQFTAGFLPGILIGLALMAYSYVMARKHGWRVSRKISGQEVIEALKQGGWGLFMPFLVLSTGLNNLSAYCFFLNFAAISAHFL